jgi:hypothetical protein
MEVVGREVSEDILLIIGMRAASTNGTVRGG